MKSHQASSAYLLLIACLISFVCFFGSYMRIPIVPLFAASLGADTVQVGLINSAFMVMAGVLSIPSGLLSDRVGRRVPLLGGLILLAVSSFLLYWSNSPLQMGCIYLVFGVGLSALSPTLMSYIADITPPEALGHAFGWYTMSLYGGMTLGPAAGGFLGSLLGLRTVFLFAGSLILFMFFVALFFLPAPSVKSRKPRMLADVMTTLLSLRRNRKLIACLMATVGGCVGFGMFVSFMPLYIRSLGMSTTTVGCVFATQALVNALSRLPAGWLCDRVGDRRILVMLGCFMLAFSIAVFGLCSSGVQLVITAAMMGISMGIAFTVACALIAASVPPKMRGLAMGCYNTSVYAGMMLCSVGMGVVIRENGFRFAFFLCGLVIAGFVVLFRILYRQE